MCSAGILGKYAKQLDISLDDGFSNTGALRAAAATTFVVAILEAAAITWVDTDCYTVCMGI
jgi:hypothetical protein